MRFKTLDDWLAWQETLHVAAIDLGLTRVGEVAGRLGVKQADHPLITIAGTNGKGSCVAMFESILGAAGYRVGSYTSPHLLRYNERVRVNQREASDEALCASFERVDAARGDTTLSFFEFGTLAAMDIFRHASLDVAILEVGLGGRLDAVNIQDADLTVITGIGIDHTDWLGTDRETIGREKAGIMRGGVPVVCGDPDPPASIAGEASSRGAVLYSLNRDFSFSVREDGAWDWRSELRGYDALPRPAIPGAVQFANASTVLMGLALLADVLPVSAAQIGAGLAGVSLPGRLQHFPGTVDTFVDVAHNRDSAAVLAGLLSSQPISSQPVSEQAIGEQPTGGRTLGVFSALRNKDIEGMVEVLTPVIDEWYVAEVQSGRGLPIGELVARTAALVGEVRSFADIPRAYEAAIAAATPRDRVVVCGSFYTVAEVMALII